MKRRAIASSIAPLAIAASLPGCPASPKTPQVPAAAPLTVAIGRDGGSLRGVAGDGTRVFAAVTLATASPATGSNDAARRRAPEDPAATGPTMGTEVAAASTVIEARTAGTLAWSTTLAGSAGPLVASEGKVFATLGGTGAIGAPTVTAGAAAADPRAVRGEPGAAVVALDAASGAVAWRVLLDTSEWVVIAAAAPAPDGVVIGGSFSGSLRLHDRVVASGGRSDGFVAKLTPAGQVAWLVRVGGPGPDAVQGVAARGDRVAVAGTFVAGADLLGHALPAFDDKSPFADGFVAALDGAGARVWSATFGGKPADSIVGVAIDTAGRVAVAATARDVVHVGGADLEAQGFADGLIAWWTKDGTASHAALVGGADFDGLRAITAVGDRIVVGGFYSGAVRIGGVALTAGGGDGAFLAAYDARGAVVDQWEVAGDGREEIVALGEVPGGFIAGVAYTAAASFTGVALPAPRDPLSGAAMAVRPVR